MAREERKMTLTKCEFCNGEVRLLEYIGSVTRADKNGNIIPTGEKRAYQYGECSRCGMRYTPQEVEEMRDG